MRVYKKFLFFLLLSSLFGCGYPIKNLDSQGTSIICFGDSITSGVGAESGKNYPYFLSQLIGKEVINAGESGDTTYEALKRLKSDVLSYDPYLVIVELGGNDFLRRIPTDVTLKNIEKIITRIQEKGAIVALVDVSWGPVMSGYRKEFKKLAKRKGLIFIPSLMRGILNDPSLKYDWIHPNSKGYKIIAHRIYKAIKPYLKY